MWENFCSYLWQWVTVLGIIYCSWCCSNHRHYQNFGVVLCRDWSWTQWGISGLPQDQTDRPFPSSLRCNHNAATREKKKTIPGEMTWVFANGIRSGSSVSCNAGQSAAAAPRGASAFPPPGVTSGRGRAGRQREAGPREGKEKVNAFPAASFP